MNDVRFERQQLREVVEGSLDAKMRRLGACTRDIAIDQADDLAAGVARRRGQVVTGNHSASNDADFHSRQVP